MVNKKRLIVWNTMCTLILILSILIPSTSALASDRHLSDEYIDIIVRYYDEVPEEEELDPAFKNIRTMSLMPVQLMTVPASSVKDISQMENVERVTYDQEMSTTQGSTNEVINSDDWNQDMIGTFDAWEEGYTGKNIQVAVLDTGFYNHDEITFAGGYSIFEDDNWENDHNGHGTHVASIIGAHQYTPAQGVAPGVELFGVKIYHSKDGDSTRASNLLSGLEWAIKKGVDIISISSGYTQYNDDIHKLIQTADQQGILVVAASGNMTENKTVIDYPAAHEEVIAVSNVDQNQQRVSDSMIGTANELAAPGYGILGLSNQPGSYSTMSGTSQSAPHVAGIAALLMQKYPNDSARSIRARMAENARDLGEEGRDDIYGYGLVHFLQEELIEEPEDDDPSSPEEPADEDPNETEETPELVEGDTPESEDAPENDDTTDEPTETQEPADDSSESEGENDNDNETPEDTETDDQEELQTTVWIRPADTDGIATIDDDDILAVADSGVLAISFDSTLNHLQNVSLTAEQIELIRDRNITLLIARIDLEWVIPASNLQPGNVLLSFESVESPMDYSYTAKSELINFSIVTDGEMITAFPEDMVYRFFTNEPELNQDALYEWNAAQEEWILLGETYTNGGVMGSTASVGTFAVFNPNELESAIVSGSEDSEPEEEVEVTPEEDASNEEEDSTESSDTTSSSLGQSGGELPVVIVGGVVILASIGGGFYFFGGKSKP